MQINKKSMLLVPGFFLTSCVTNTATNALMPDVSSSDPVELENKSNISQTKPHSLVDPTGMTAAHNQWRSKTGVPALKWSDTLAQDAQQWAEHLTENGCHPKDSGGKYGENIYLAGPAINSDGNIKVEDITAQNVVDSWGDEIKDYDYKDNSCKFVCRHYTQIVWKNTTEVGCGMATCADKSQIWVCQYTPTGNMAGEKPY
ncbi:MAG: SCP-like extracellular [Candidatus Electrothrix sp. AW2]|nr:SCP-like extracellular [Candidatus Electrothrix gigas]